MITDRYHTPDEALAEVRIAMEGWLETAREPGDRVPEPRYRPDIYQPRAAE